LNIAVLSGKGGAGKTFVAVNLTMVVPHALYVDADVEEPDGRFFFPADNLEAKDVTVGVPVVDPHLCTGCRKCVDFCRFHALSFINGAVRTFPKLCHACGGCMLVCPEGAITECRKPVGRIRAGRYFDHRLLFGELIPGEQTGVPVIEELLADIGEVEHAIIDCPPGAGCPVTACVQATDYCLVVMEPTRFGVHDFIATERLLKTLGKPYGVILNKSTSASTPGGQYCIDNALPVLARIPYDPAIASIHSEGKLVVEENEAQGHNFIDLRERLQKEVGR